MFKLLFELATTTPFRQIKNFPELSEKAKINITEDRIESVRETYEDVIDEFIDNVFGYECLLSRENWKDIVCREESWIVNPD